MKWSQVLQLREILSVNEHNPNSKFSIGMMLYRGPKFLPFQHLSLFEERERQFH